MIYYAILAILIGLRFWPALNDRAGDGLYKAAFAILFIFSAFRYEVGCDWTSYILQYEVSIDLGNQALLEIREPLWWLLARSVRLAELPFPWLNVITSLIFFAGVHHIARRQPDRFGFLIFLFPILIFNIPMSGIRQGAAIGLMCFAFTAYTDAKLWRFLLFTALASGFHSSAIIFLLLAPSIGQTNMKWRIALTLLLAIPGIYLLVGSSNADLARTRYVGSGVDSAGATFRVSLLMITGSFFMIVLRKQWRALFPEEYKIINLAAIAMIGLLLAVPISSVMADRYGYYLIIFQSIIVTRITYLSIDRSSYTILLAIFLIYSGLFVTWTTKSWYFKQCYIPYRFWLME